MAIKGIALDVIVRTVMIKEYVEVMVLRCDMMTAVQYERVGSGLNTTTFCYTWIIQESYVQHSFTLLLKMSWRVSHLKIVQEHKLVNSETKSGINHIVLIP